MSATTVTPDPAAVARAFLRPRRQPGEHRPGPGEMLVNIKTSSGALVASAWGCGSTVLLIHGWEGSRADMAAIGASAGARYRAVSVDLPAHGASPGESTSVPALADAIAEIADALGPIDAVVAHSVGAVATMAALSRHRFTSKAVMLGAPARYTDYARAFATAAGLDGSGVAAVVAELYALGVDLGSIDAPRLATGLGGIAALFVHSTDDRVVPIEDVRDTVRAWPGAQLVEVQGLGHQRLLRDPDVIQAVRNFLS